MATSMQPEPQGPTIVKKTRALGGWAVLIIAIIAGAGAALLAVRTIQQKEALLADKLLKSQNKEVVYGVVPVDDLKAGTVLDITDVARRPIPADTAPSDLITPENFGGYAGQRLKVDVARGRPLLASYLSAREALGSLLDAEHVAMTLTVDNVSTLDGMLRPGDVVDLLWLHENPTNGASELPLGSTSSGGLTIRRGGETDKESVRFLEHGLKVIATGQRTLSGGGGASIDAESEGSRSFSSVTLELTPRQAQRIMLAKKTGDLQLILRNAEKPDTAHPQILTLRDIVGYGRGPAWSGIEYIMGGGNSTGTPSVRMVPIAAASPEPATRPGRDPRPVATVADPTAGDIRYVPFPYQSMTNP